MTLHGFQLVASVCSTLSGSLSGRDRPLFIPFTSLALGFRRPSVSMRIDSTILASPSISNFLSFHDLQRPRVSTFPSSSRVLPDFPDLPFYPSHACNFFFIVYRRWMSGRRVFWLVDELSSLLPLFNSSLDLALRKYEFELAALFSIFPSSRFRFFQIRVSLCCHLPGLMLRAHDSELRKIILNLRTSQTVDNPIDKFYDGSLCYG